MRKIRIYPIYLLFLLAILNGCGVLDDIESPIIIGEAAVSQNVLGDGNVDCENPIEESQTTAQSTAGSDSSAAGLSQAAEDLQGEVHRLPSKEAVESARTLVLEGMSEEEAERLKENIKVANMAMERAYLNDNIFDRLSDPEDLYWNYIDQKGEIQIGWALDGTAVMAYNRFDADNFIALMEDMEANINDTELLACMEQLIQNTEAAKDTHDVEYVRAIYELLHDMDYYLLRYGPEDVAKYVKDASLICTYYGTLPFYEGVPE